MNRRKLQSFRRARIALHGIAEDNDVVTLGLQFVAKRNSTPATSPPFWA